MTLRQLCDVIARPGVVGLSGSNDGRRPNRHAFSEVMDVARFNPAPGWPEPPAGWFPPPGWQPDPTWPPAPPGWAILVDDDAEPAPESEVSREPEAATYEPPAAPATSAGRSTGEPDVSAWQATAPGPQDFAPPEPQYPAQPQYPGQQYPPGQPQYSGQPQYPGQQHFGQQYPGQAPYPGQQYPGQPYYPGAPGAPMNLPPWAQSVTTAPTQAKVAIGAGVVMILGSLLPWVAAGQLGFRVYHVPGIFRLLSVLLGAAVIGGIFAMQMLQYRVRAMITGLAASGLAVLLYAGVAVRGWMGKRELFTYTWNPGGGLIIAFIAAVTAAACYCLLYKPRPGITP